MRASYLTSTINEHDHGLYDLMKKGLKRYIIVGKNGLTKKELKHQVDKVIKNTIIVLHL